MKRNFKRIISVVLIMSVLFSSAFTFNVHAADVPEYDSCADYYFSNLSGNDVPFNVLGSCGYVAMAMLLSYYDVYWNDNFVANDYERDATYKNNSNTFVSSVLKTENETLLSMYSAYQQAGGTLDEKTYLESIYENFVDDNQDNGYLHLDLIGIAMERGYYDGILQIEKYGISLYDMAYIMDDYLDIAFGSNQYYFLLEQNIPENQPITIKMEYSKNIGTSNADVLAKMHELTEENTPYILIGVNSSDDSDVHLMVGYGAVKQNEQIIDYKLHTGWGNNPYTTFNDTIYSSDIGILWLEIDESRIPHVCCDNFIVGDERSCSCRVYGDLHPKHVHEAGDVYLSMGAEVHNVRCLWDNGIVLEPHHFINCIQTSSTAHTGFCDCGYVMYNLTHQLTEYTYISNLYHKASCVCGYFENEMHTTRTISNRYSECTICGAIFDMWSTPTIKKVDDPPIESD